MTTKIGYTLFRPGQEPLRGEAEFDGINYKTIKMAVEPLIDNEPLEHVAVLHNNRRADMFVSEVGAIHGLPRNEHATTVYRNNSMTRDPTLDPESIPAIYGPAVLFDQIVWS